MKGIGEKTATALLQQYGSVENIYEHLDDVTPARAKTALEANRDMAFLSKTLVTIRTDVPLDVAWEDCAVHSYDRAQVEALFDELEFMNIRKRLPTRRRGQNAHRGTQRSGRQMAMFAPGDDRRPGQGRLAGARHDDDHRGATPRP